VVRLERVAVGVAEGVGELFGGVGEVVAEALGGEVEAAMGGWVSRGFSRSGEWGWRWGEDGGRTASAIGVLLLRCASSPSAH